MGECLRVVHMLVREGIAQARGKRTGSRWRERRGRVGRPFMRRAREANAADRTIDEETSRRAEYQQQRSFMDDRRRWGCTSRRIFFGKGRDNLLLSDRYLFSSVYVGESE